MNMTLWWDSVARIRCTVKAREKDEIIKINIDDISIQSYGLTKRTMVG